MTYADGTPDALCSLVTDEMTKPGLTKRATEACKAHRVARVAAALATVDHAALKDAIRARLCERAWNGDESAIAALLVGHY